MGLKNDLKTLRGYNFRAWKQTLLGLDTRAIEYNINMHDYISVSTLKLILVPAVELELVGEEGGIR